MKILNKIPIVRAFVDKPSKEDLADFMQTFRYGTFDSSGYVHPMYVSNSKKVFAGLGIPEGTKPFKYPIEGGTYVDVYLRGNEDLDDNFSRGNRWLCAEKLFHNYELTGSLTGKLSEQYQRISEIKSKLSGEFSVRAHLFIVIMLMLAGIATGYTIGTYVFH